MAYGDIGGPITELIVTCKTNATGDVSIAKNDAVKLTGPFTVDNGTDAEDVIFGQAKAACTTNDTALPVVVRGVAILPFTGAEPSVDGAQGVLASATAGRVKAPASGNGLGINLQTRVGAQTLTLASVANGDSVTINGLTFTAHTDTTSKADRQFSISGDDAADAAALAGLINDPVYGVPGLTATIADAVVTVTARDWTNTTVTVADAAATMTAAVTGGTVAVLL